MSRIERHIGKYELLERLGSRDMTEVWKALDTGLQRNVAIKLLHADLQGDPDFVKRFEREARIVASLHHPNIMQIHEFQIAQLPESESTIAYMVMDYVEGPTLADYIAKTSRVGEFPSAAELVHLFASIGAAVDYAHKKGIIHRNLTPVNILLDQSNAVMSNPMGEAMLTDFGVAKLLGASTGTFSGLLSGNPQCMSPEQAQGQPGTERSDIYALGVILYEICTGVLPFRGENPAEIMRQQMSSLPTPPNLMNSKISPALAEVILHSLAKDPAARFPSAVAMTTALKEAFHMSVPGNLRTPTYTTNLANSPIHLTPLSPGLTPSMPGLLPQAVVASASLSTPSTNEGQVFFPPSVQTPPHVLLPSQPILTSPPSSPIAPQKKRKGWLLGLIALILVALVGSGLLIFLLPYGRPATTNQFGGHVFFVNSGQLNEDSSQGLNDELQIDLKNIPAPTPGKSYYAWLLGDTVLDVDKNSSPDKQTAPILLGSLPFNNESISFHYRNPQQFNLLAITSRLLITEEDAHSFPPPPSADHRTWRYFGEIPQLRPHTIAESELGSLRHLLCDGPNLLQQGIHGGTAIQLLLHTQSILEWASSARDAWNGTQTGGESIKFIDRQLIRILDYLDGTALIMKDVPPGTLPLVDAKKMQNGLLGVKVNPKSYIDRISGTMQDLIIAPQVASGTPILARQIKGDIDNVQNWLGQVRQDARQLLLITDAQLQQPQALTLLDDMRTQANSAFVGQRNPSIETIQGGAVQIYYSIQRLATFDIEQYTSR